MSSRLITALKSPREALIYLLAGKERYRESLSIWQVASGMVTSKQFSAQKGFNQSKAKFFDRPVGMLVDPELIQVVKRLMVDFALKNFVETGTFRGETSFFFSGLFDKVFTCDVVDHPRRIEFYCIPNLIYETKASPRFLKDHLDEIRLRSFFFLDAHWFDYWPLRDELRIIFDNCADPVILIDDFDGKEGLEFDSYGGVALDSNYIADLVPPSFKYFGNDYSKRNRGMIFLFPDKVEYGCYFRSQADYDPNKHSLWGRLAPVHE